MKIAELLEAKGHEVATVVPDALVRDVVAELTKRNIGAVVVSGDRHRIEGIVSERDIVRAIDAHGPSALDRPVRSIMSTPVEVSTPDDAVDSLMATMTEHRIRHLPVVADGDLVGIVSIGDVVKSRTEELEAERAALVDYIGAR